MLERSIVAAAVIDAHGQDNAAVRERLKPNFGPGAARRMTLLGMMVGSAVKAIERPQISTFVYSSVFGESVSLEAYLKSFPTPSPTLFQSSIHPSAVQQSLIPLQAPVSEVIPLAGGPELVLQSAMAVLTHPEPELVWCGGDERGTWLREIGVAAERSFAFALALRSGADAKGIGTIRLESMADRDGALTFSDWFELIRERRSWTGAVGSGWRLHLEWT